MLSRGRTSDSCPMSSGVWTIGVFSPMKRRVFFAQQQCSEASVSLCGGERPRGLAPRTNDLPADAGGHLFVRGCFQKPLDKAMVEVDQFGFSGPGKIGFKIDEGSGSFCPRA